MLPALHLTDEVRWADEVRVDVGVSHWKLAEGYVFGVETDDGTPAGFVFVGDGSADVTFAEPAEALAFGAGMAVDAEGRELADRVVRDQHFIGDFDTALVLGADPSPALAVADLPVVSEFEDGTVYVDAPPQRYDVFVTSWRLGPARSRAADVLARRVDRLAAVGLDPRSAIVLDGLESGRSRWVAETHGTRSWLPLIEPASTTLQDEWMSFVHDPTHAVDDRYLDTALIHGLHDPADADPEPRLRILTGLRDPTPRLGARIESATVNVTALPTPTGQASHMAFEARLVVISDVPTRALSLALPREEENSTLRGAILSGEPFELQGFETVSGDALTSVGTTFGPWAPPGDWEIDTWQLPDVVEPGVPVTVDVRWTDQWPTRHMLEAQEWALSELIRAHLCKPPRGGEGKDTCACFVQGIPTALDLGAVVEARPVVPRSWVGPERFPAEIRVAVPQGRWEVAVQGVTRQVPAGDGVVTIAETTGAARVTLTRSTAENVSAAGPFPAIQVLRTHPEDGDYASLVRAVMNFYQPALPPWTGGPLSVVEAPEAPVISKAMLLAREQQGCKLEAIHLSELNHHQPMLFDQPGRAPDRRDTVWVGSVPGQILISGLRELGSEVGGASATARKDYPHLVERGVAQGVAAQWFGDLELARRDVWIADAAAAWLRDRFVDEAWGEDVASRWQDVVRNDLRDTMPGARVLPLGAHPWTGEIGAQVLHVLEARIGEEHVLRGLDGFLRSDDPTTEGLEHAMSAASGVDLRPFFDAWVTAGLRPHLTGTWEVVDGNVALTVTADPPLGVIDVPVGVTTRTGVRTAWVRLVNGQGTTSLAVRGTPLRVEMDPDEVLPVRASAMTRIGPRPSEHAKPAATPDRVAGS